MAALALGAEAPRASAAAPAAGAGLWVDFGATALPASAGLVQTSGFRRVGIGAARYALSARQAGPASATHRKSRNGTWFDLAEEVRTPQMFGALGDGVGDDSAAWRAAAAAGPVWCFSGTHRFARSVALGARVEMAPAAASARTTAWSSPSPAGSPRRPSRCSRTRPRAAGPSSSIRPTIPCPPCPNGGAPGPASAPSTASQRSRPRSSPLR